MTQQSMDHVSDHGSAHLSEEALDDLLIGIGSATSEAHIAVCDLCRAKAETFQTDMQSFNDASLRWSEAKPAIKLRAPAKAWEPQAFGFSMRWAAPALLLLLVCAGVWNYEHAPVKDQPVASASDAQDDEVQIAQDNQLLQSVNSALSDPDVYAVSAYHLEKSPRPHMKSVPRSRTR